MQFFKYHALGNDYIVLNPQDIKGAITQSQIKILCHRNFGIGSDGILLGPFKDLEADFKLKIFNPDASEAEKSGNGLRIFSRYLWDMGFIKDKPFTINTLGGIVKSQIKNNGQSISVEMGAVSFDSNKIPVKECIGEVINKEMVIKDQNFIFCGATIGNPHCIIICDNLSEKQVKEFGPLIENDPRFPNRTNVQFMKILDRNNIQLEIWERGAGYTLASGSSSSAAAATAFKLKLCDRNIKVHMPGGKLDIEIMDNFYVFMTGPVTKVAQGIISKEIW